MPTACDGSIFSGGVSLRDYGTLLDAMRDIHAPLLIATRNTDDSWMSDASSERGRAADEPAGVQCAHRDGIGRGGPARAARRSWRRADHLSERDGPRQAGGRERRRGGARLHSRMGRPASSCPRREPARTRSRVARRCTTTPHGHRRIGEAARRDVIDRFGLDQHLEHLLASSTTRSSPRPANRTGRPRRRQPCGVCVRATARAAPAGTRRPRGSVLARVAASDRRPPRAPGAREAQGLRRAAAAPRRRPRDPRAAPAAPRRRPSPQPRRRPWRSPGPRGGEGLEEDLRHSLGQRGVEETSLRDRHRLSAGPAGTNPSSRDRAASPSASQPIAQSCSSGPSPQTHSLNAGRSSAHEGKRLGEHQWVLLLVEATHAQHA